MKSRLIGGTAAGAMALLGGVLIFTYAGNADDRAVADLQPTEVLVVQNPVAAGTPAEDLGQNLAVETLPAKAIAATALKNLDGSAGKVTATNLVPGEQLLTERLVPPEEIQSAGSVEVPKGLQEVSFQLEPQRVAGGQIVAGDHVGIFISFEEGGLPDSPGEPAQLVLHKTLVTAMQGAPQPTSEEGTAGTQALPEGSMMVTVAVDDLTAQKIVFAAEFGRIWLSKEPSDAKESKPDVLQKDEVFR